MQIKIREEKESGKQYVWDIIRKKEILLTPEEWVRQQIIHYLISAKNYPSSLFSVEKQIKIGSISKRYDIVIYKKDKAWMLIEVKAENKKINPNVLQQALAYKSKLDVAYICLCNGHQIACYHTTTDSWFDFFPDYA